MRVVRQRSWREPCTECDAMDIELAATHEAGHSVMQWLMGWEAIELQMSVRDSSASHVSARCPYPSLATRSALRKRLLVLFAGNAATRQRWPESDNDWSDWNNVLRALQTHFQRPAGIKWTRADGRMLRDVEANEVMQTAMSKCGEIVGHPLVQEATVQIAMAFASLAGENGVVRFNGREVVSILRHRRRRGVSGDESVVNVDRWRIGIGAPDASLVAVVRRRPVDPAGHSRCFGVLYARDSMTTRPWAASSIPANTPTAARVLLLT
ncbi:MAG: hypothetical protein ACOC7K_01005 [bacterium]